MSTLKEAMETYHNLSCYDRIVFYSTLVNDIQVDKDHIQDILVETSFADQQSCIHCGSTHFVKNGVRKDGTQRYLCRDCNRSFLMNTNSISSRSRKRLSVWKRYFDCLMDKKTLKESAEECEISMGTAFLWRHKILDALEEMEGKVCLEGTVQADETFLNVSYKGNHGKAKESAFILPRKAHRRGNDVHKKGLSSEKVCVVCAVNEENIPIAKVGKTGKVSSECIEKVLGDRLGDKTVLCTDHEQAYRSFAEAKKIELIQMDVDCYEKGNYNIQRINAYHSHLKRFLDHFHGVSTKYLNNYLTWYNLMLCSPKEKEETERMIMGYSMSVPKQIRCLDVPDRPPIPSLV